MIFDAQKHAGKWRPTKEQRYLVEDLEKENSDNLRLADFIQEAVDSLDLTKIIDSYTGRGKDAYYPKVLLTVMLMGYALGITSCRKLTQAVREHLIFKYLSKGYAPKKNTFNSFRLRLIGEIESIFDQVLVLAHEKGLLTLEGVALDGSKIQANASKHKSLSFGFMEINKPKVQAQIEELKVKEREQAQGDKALPEGMNVKDDKALPEGMSIKDDKALPEGMNVKDDKAQSKGMSIKDELERREKKLAKYEWVTEEILCRVVPRDEKKMLAYNQSMERRQNLIDQGKKPRGRAPKKPETGPQKNDQVNLTDTDSRIMPKSGGKEFIQGYNVQGVVDVETMILVHTFVSQQTNDKCEMKPALQGLEALPDVLGKVKWMSADAGYYSSDNVQSCCATGIEPLIAIDRQSHYMNPFERFAKDGPPPPEDASNEEKMAYRLKTKDGKAKYGLRKQTIEPVFGNIKTVMKWNKMSMRGLAKCTGEWCLAALAWNLKRMCNLKREKPKIA